jgi:hypothetical protein
MRPSNLTEWQMLGRVHLGRVAVAHVQGLPKGGSAWTHLPQVTRTRLLGRGLSKRRFLVDMRAMMGGPISLVDIQFKIQELVDNLQANGVDEINHLNIYFVPRAAGRTARFYLPSGDEIDTLRFDEGETKVFTPITDNVRAEPSAD